MAKSKTKPKQKKAKSLKNDCLETFRWMIYGRFFEDKIAALYRAGGGKVIVGGAYLGRGQEAFSAALGVQLKRKSGDVYAPLIRDQAGRMAFGEPLIDAARTYLGSSRGPMRGRDGNIHRGRPRHGMPAMISHLGSTVSVINGMLMAKRYRGETGFAGGAAIGDGGTSTGSFHEALNQAAVEKLPLIVAVANNQFAYSTPVARQFACEDLVKRAAGYGVNGYSIDGTDILACVKTFREAVKKARAGEGPQLIVGKLLRLAGHGEHDDAKYVPQSVKEDHFGRDCMEAAQKEILDLGWMKKNEIKNLEKAVRAEVEETISRAQNDPPPNPARDDWSSLQTSRLLEENSTWNSVLLGRGDRSENLS